MNNNLILMPTNPISLNEVNDIQEIINHSIQLKPKEIKQVLATYSNAFYDMSSEYIWSRAIALLREKILVLGIEFISEMLNRTDIISPNELQSSDIIMLSYELGFINKTARMKLDAANSYVMHYQSREADEDMDKQVADLVIKSAIQYILGIENETLGLVYNNFRDRLKKELINSSHELWSAIINSPYFYKKTTVKTLLNLLRTTDDAEYDVVSTNLKAIVPNLWDVLLSDDRYPIGFAYAESVNSGDKKNSTTLKAVLLKVQGFDYVPENLRSTAFINLASKLVSTHFAIDNFYNEPAVIDELASLGTIVPSPALGHVITSVLFVKLGNRYGISNAAQYSANKILSTISEDRWIYYFNNVINNEERLLESIKDTSIQKRWFAFIKEYGLNNISDKIKTKDSNKIIEHSISQNAISLTKTIDIILKNMQ